MTSGAQVFIDGRPIASQWDGSELLALRGLTIKWGRSRVYDDPEPSVLTLRMIDRRGRFINDLGRIGQTIVIRQIDPDRAVFRGTISKPKARRARVYNPGTQADETVWVVTLTATDTLGALSSAVYPGDAIDGWREGAGGWSETGPSNRLQQLYDAGAKELVDGFDDIPRISDPGVASRRIAGQLASDARTALELIRDCYRTATLCVASFDPDQNRIVASQLPATAPATLTYSGGVVRLAIPAGLTIPASKVGVASYELASEVDNAIDVVQLSYWYYGRDPQVTAGSQKRTTWTRGMVEARTARYNPRTRKVLRIDTELMKFDPAEFVDGAVTQLNAYVPLLLAATVAAVNKLNGQLRMPSLIFDAARSGLPPAVESVVFYPVAQPVPIYFSGSVFNGMEAVGPQFQIIGGTLAYDGGWTHEVTVAAAGSASPSTLSIAQVVTNPDVTLGRFDPDISLADLGQITTGLA